MGRKLMAVGVTLIVIGAIPRVSHASPFGVLLKGFADEALATAAREAGKAAIDIFRNLFNQKRDMRKDRGESSRSINECRLDGGEVKKNRRNWTVNCKRDLSRVEMDELITILRRLDKRDQVLRGKADGSDRVLMTNARGSVAMTSSTLNRSTVQSAGDKSVLINGQAGTVTVNYGMDEVDRLAGLLKEAENAESKLEIVSVSVQYNKESRPPMPTVDIKLRNVGKKVAFIKTVRLERLGEATFEDCHSPLYSLQDVTASYDIDIDQPEVDVSQVLKADDTDRFALRVFRTTGGPTMTVYKTKLAVIYNGSGQRVESEPFFIRMIGPTLALGSTSFPVTKEHWDACVARNRKAFGAIDYKIYED